jgi:hypothetical protein
MLTDGQQTEGCLEPITGLRSQSIAGTLMGHRNLFTVQRQTRQQSAVKLQICTMMMTLIC